MDRDTTLLWIREVAERTDVLTRAAPKGQTMSAERINPTCGDRVELVAHLDGNGLVHLRGSVRGCVLSTAAANVAAAALEDLSLEAAVHRIESAAHNRLFASDLTLSDDDLDELVRLELVPLRRRCVALPWQLTADLLKGLAVDR